MTVDLSCIVHVHSTYSDGTATVPELLDAARRAGAQVLILTDHDSVQAARDGWEGWHDGVLLIVGHEISTDRGHLLAFQTEAEIRHSRRSERDVCAAVRRAGGFGIAAHPFSEGSRISRRIGRPHPWSALGEPGCDGVELWSAATDAAESWSSPLAAWRTLRHPERTLAGPPDRHLRLWDALAARRRVVAVGGLDAHQPGLRVGRRVYSIMPHERWFRLLRTHVQLGAAPSADAPSATAAVLTAIREGRCYLARVDLGDPTGFAFVARSASGATACMGAQAPPGAWRLVVETPRPATIRVLHDGQLIARRDGTVLTCDTAGPGAYRVEAVLSAHGAERRWIVSNPIYLR